MKYRFLPGETIPEWAKRVVGRRRDPKQLYPTRAAKLPDEHIVYEGWFGRGKASQRTLMRRVGIE